MFESHSGECGFESWSGHPELRLPWFPEVTRGKRWDGSLIKAMAESFLSLCTDCASGLHVWHYNTTLDNSVRFDVSNSTPAISLLASHQGEPGSVPSRTTPGFSHVGFVPDNAAGPQVFAGISCYPNPCIPGLLNSHLTLLSSALKTSAGPWSRSEGVIRAKLKRTSSASSLLRARLKLFPVAGVHLDFCSRFDQLESSSAACMSDEAGPFAFRTYTRQKARSKYRNSIRLERASKNQSSNTHKTTYDRVKRCRERKINIKASERVNEMQCGFLRWGGGGYKSADRSCKPLWTDLVSDGCSLLLTVSYWLSCRLASGLPDADWRVAFQHSASLHWPGRKCDLAVSIAENNRNSADVVESSFTGVEPRNSSPAHHGQHMSGWCSANSSSAGRNSGGGCRVGTSPEFAVSSTPLAELALRIPDIASSLVRSPNPEVPLHWAVLPSGLILTDVYSKHLAAVLEFLTFHFCKYEDWLANRARPSPKIKVHPVICGRAINEVPADYHIPSPQQWNASHRRSTGRSTGSNTEAPDNIWARRAGRPFIFEPGATCTPPNPLPGYFHLLINCGRLPPRRFGLNTRLGHSGLSHVGIVPDDAVGRRAFSGSPVSPTPSFRCRSIFTPITLIGSEDLDVKNHALQRCTSIKQATALVATMCSLGATRCLRTTNLRVPTLTRAALTRTSSASSFLRARRAVFPSAQRCLPSRCASQCRPFRFPEKRETGPGGFCPLMMGGRRVAARVFGTRQVCGGLPRDWRTWADRDLSGGRDCNVVKIAARRRGVITRWAEPCVPSCTNRRRGPREIDNGSFITRYAFGSCRSARRSGDCQSNSAYRNKGSVYDRNRASERDSECPIHRTLQSKNETLYAYGRGTMKMVLLTSPDKSRFNEGGVVVRLLASHTGEPGFDSRRGRSRIFACGNRSGRCPLAGGFFRRSPVPPPPSLYSGAAPYSPCFILIGSQDLLELFARKSGVSCRRTLENRDAEQHTPRTPAAFVRQKKMAPLDSSNTSTHRSPISKRPAATTRQTIKLGSRPSSQPSRDRLMDGRLTDATDGCESTLTQPKDHLPLHAVGRRSKTKPVRVPDAARRRIDWARPHHAKIDSAHKTVPTRKAEYMYYQDTRYNHAQHTHRKIAQGKRTESKAILYKSCECAPCVANQNLMGGMMRPTVVLLAACSRGYAGRGRHPAVEGLRRCSRGGRGVRKLLFDAPPPLPLPRALINR
ncbi:hypothetical protein PR048_015380 [Dryococelus australis]|uniref:Uncharacterized protein n=1 Tax=Dryococelus australis TaxID=614101 RepID=A0ABQ9HHB9_9NEOP|nr:hypothetical protein PR048_015380 [Dryococelus australis]